MHTDDQDHAFLNELFKDIEPPPPFSYDLYQELEGSDDESVSAFFTEQVRLTYIHLGVFLAGECTQAELLQLTREVITKVWKEHFAEPFTAKVAATIMRAQHTAATKYTL